MTTRFSATWHLHSFICLGKLRAKRQNWEGSILLPLWKDGNSEGDGNGKSGLLKCLGERFFITEQKIWNHKRNTDNIFAF